MGNELFRNYSIEKNSFLTAGHFKLWKIFNATHKDRKNTVCVFVFEKKSLEKFPKNEREQLLTLLKEEAKSLIKFKHPNILSIIEPLAEDKYSIGFITETFKYSLTSWVQNYKPSKLESKLIISELVNVISFLHSNCNVIHANINPDNIFIDHYNKIKIAGLNFAVDSNGKDNEIKYTLNYYSSILNPIINYIAPEIVYQSKISKLSDVYSIGAIIFYLLNKKEDELMILSNNSIEDYKRGFSYIEEKIRNLTNVDNGDIDIILQSTKNANQRPNIEKLLNFEWFTDYNLKALSFIETLPLNDIKKNYEFLKELPSMLSLFENKLITNRFLPALFSGMKIEGLINPIVPAIFAICEMKDININFEDIIWPHLKELFKLKTIPAASLYFLLSKMTYIGERLSSKEFTEHCIPIICKAMDCGVSKIQSVIVDNLSFVSNNIDSTVFSTQIYPRIIQILLHTDKQSLKTRLILSIKNVYGLLSQEMINNNLVDDLEKLRRIDSSSSICAGIILIYEELLKIVSIDVIRKKVIPNLLSLMIEGNISNSTYSRVGELVNKYIDRIKKIRTRELTENDDFKIEKNEEEGQSIVKLKQKNLKENKQFLEKFFGSKITNSLLSQNEDQTEDDDNTNDKFAINYLNGNDNNDVNFDAILSKKENKINDESKPKKFEIKSSLSKMQKPEKEGGLFDSLLNEFDNEDNNNISKPKKFQVVQKEERKKAKTFQIQEPPKEEVKKEEHKVQQNKNSKSNSILALKDKKSGWEDEEEEDSEIEKEFNIPSKNNQREIQTPEPQKTIIHEFKKSTDNMKIHSKSKKHKFSQFEKEADEDLNLDSLLND